MIAIFGCKRAFSVHLLSNTTTALQQSVLPARPTPNKSSTRISILILSVKLEPKKYSKVLSFLRRPQKFDKISNTMMALQQSVLPARPTKSAPALGF
jgi:hypothetical protein